MAYPATALEVFIASPSDVPAERTAVREVVAEWNAIHSRERGIALMSVGWETHSSPELSGRPQEMVNQRILAYADVLVGIFSTRIGTATGKAASGTIEEIEEHVAAGKPAMLYFSNAPIQRDADRAQLDELQKFKASATPRGIVAHYTTVDEFAGLFRKHLPIMLRDNQYVRRLLGSGPTGTLPQEFILSERAEKLLRAAVSGDGEVSVLDHMQGTNIEAGGQNFSADIPRETAKLKSAVLELERQGLIHDPAGKREVYNVTGEGYEAVDNKS